MHSICAADLNEEGRFLVSLVEVIGNGDHADAVIMDIDPSDLAVSFPRHWFSVASVSTTPPKPAS